MPYLVIGAAGFVSVGLYDVAQMSGKKRAATVFSSIGYLGILASIVFLMLSIRPPHTPFDFLLPKIVFVLLAFLLLIYSVVIEIPLAKRRGSAPGRTVVSAGFYGMVRHPGFVWFALFCIGLFAIYQDRLVAEVGAGLVLLNLLLIVIEDTLLFPRIFIDYEAYKKRVPFLIPRLRKRANDEHT